MYRYKYYYKDGTNELSGCGGQRPEMMFYDFDGLMDWDEYESLQEKKLTTHEILEMAMEVYKGFLKDFYRIEIVNDETNEVVDYIDDSEAIVDNKKGHVIYDVRTGDIIGAYVDSKHDYSDCVYRFKYYYKDGTSELSGVCSKTPEGLFNDFDGLMDWDEFDSLNENNMTTHKVLELAMEVYKGFLKDFYRIEIVNDETNEVVDYIDETETREVK